MTLKLADNPNYLSDRAAMALPEDLFVARTPATVFSTHLDLLRLAPAQWVAIAQDPGAPFERRYAAGALLGFAGDPRIRPLDPEMCDVPAAQARLGTEPEQVPQVIAEWERVGVIEEWIAKECPRYTTELAAYRMMRYPVTNLEYRRFLEETGAPWLPTSWAFGVYPVERANHPVWSVPAEAADAYADWLSEATGRRFRLPSEAEWEYAASGGTGVEYPWGDAFDPRAANTVEAGPLSTTPVGIFPLGRSVFGIDDLAGNVEEYVADDYHPYPGGAAIDDDLALTQGSYRIARGGSFTRFGDLARCARRHGRYQRDIYAMGFRLVEAR
ncbi:MULTISPECIES: formylglycine-generating enzyme family protein [Burkholderia]|uniref:Serine/threonine protein kinase n=1 Tax=Burkholderia mayonis TaxID=1385591 RepID=A0A1B4FLY4_9BURK|nr:MULTISPECIES: SUMF1/EgtB/PvdO family nonheme iron enzyme [Burkholderia]AOJ04688.1 serine/threonine protein kinase [Burkholderia mayonis]KVE36887.1 serine/threonine protein kinase [Burkholderia sp. BDU5]KVE41225.1 serine/threonine protein kinase [Burkholderia mayonis]